MKDDPNWRESIAAYSKGILVTQDGQVGIKPGYINSDATIKLARLLDDLLKNDHVVLVSNDPIKLMWRK